VSTIAADFIAVPSHLEVRSRTDFGGVGAHSLFSSPSMIEVNQHRLSTEYQRYHFTESDGTMVPVDYSKHFAGKKITVMGLGLLGRGVGDAEFLARHGAELIVTDLKTEVELATSLERLQGFSNITYRLGGHDLADFQGRDFILKAAGVPLNSPYIAEARKHHIPIKMSASWFAEVSGIPTVGVTGTRGKSTTTMMLYDIMRAAGMEVLLGGNVRGVSTLALLDQITPRSIALMELDSWQCQGWGEVKMSPNVAVFTTFMRDHMNYYHDDMRAYLWDKAQIFINQKPEDTFVVSDQVLPQLDEFKHVVRSHVSVARPGHVDLSVPGEHNQLNAACALGAARALGIDDAVSLGALKAFRGVEGRLQLVREVRGVTFYNDTNSTTPDATLVALRALGTEKTILIMGGADKGLDMAPLMDALPQRVVYLKGTGTERLGITGTDLNSAFAEALRLAHPGDTILFSPAFASFGLFKNEYDRGDQFSALVAALT
jgi:UDP-N-acetylmuramoylalanine--D-glutamate ligase